MSLILIDWLYFTGGFQGMPGSLRQPGPRANLRHMSPGSNTQGPRGAFTNNRKCSECWPTPPCKCTLNIPLIGSFWPDHGPPSIHGSPRPQVHTSIQICHQCSKPKSSGGAAYCHAAGMIKSQHVPTEWLVQTEILLSPVVDLCFQAQPAVHVQGQEPLTASMLAAAPPQEQKQMLGKSNVWLFLFFKIQNYMGKNEKENPEKNDFVIINKIRRKRVYRSTVEGSLHKIK